MALELHSPLLGVCLVSTKYMPRSLSSSGTLEPLTCSSQLSICVVTVAVVRVCNNLF